MLVRCIEAKKIKHMMKTMVNADSLGEKIQQHEDNCKLKNIQQRFIIKTGLVYIAREMREWKL